MRSEGQVLNLNRKSQLSNRGITGEGTPITPSYKPRTIEIKKRKGQTTKFVTLRDTGDFQDNFKIVYRQNEIEISADATHHAGVGNIVQHLQGRYGKEIFGLTEENITRVQKIILPDILQQLRNE